MTTHTADLLTWAASWLDPHATHPAIVGLILIAAACVAAASIGYLADRAEVHRG